MTVGATVSTVQERLAGVSSVLPARSVARTSTVWSPWARPVRVSGEVQAWKVPPSTRHSNVAVSSAVNSTVALVEETKPVGPDVMVVWGALVSTVKGTGVTGPKAPPVA